MITNKYGLIGKTLSHSFSEKYFSQKFIAEKIEGCEYINFELEQIGDIEFLRANNLSLKGFNVTIPYKQEIIDYLDYKNEAVTKVGACNCVKIMDGKLHGYNTDVIGFEKSLKPLLKPNMKTALILGKGGAAKAVAYVLESLNIKYQYAVREINGGNQIPFAVIENNWALQYDIIINCTPVGTYPKIEDCPPILFDGKTDLKNILFYDLIYNPELTKFLQLALLQNGSIKNGYEMLALQAEASWEIWNP